MKIKPPPIIVDPPPVTVTPPPIKVTPPPVTITPPSVTVQPAPVTVPGNTVTPPSINVQPDTITVRPDSIRVTPPSITVQPAPVKMFGQTVTPPSIKVQPDTITVTPDPIRVTPPAIRVQPAPVTVPGGTVTPPALNVQPKALTVNPPPINLTSQPITIDPPPMVIQPPEIEIRSPLPPLVASGDLPPKLTAFDKTMRAYMEKYKITAGELAVMKDGRLVFNRGYGWLNPLHTEAVQPDTPMRFASVVKPITRAAVHKLIADGKKIDGQPLTLQTKAFVALGIQPLNLPGHQMDNRLKDITIQHLIDHKGGWDRNQLPLSDPMFQTTLISLATGHQPAGADDVIRFMAGQPLQRTPGAKEIYSNFGYCVLGRIIEKASGKKYIDYVRAELLAPLGADSFEVGRSLPADRNPREPAYVSLEPPGPNVMNPFLPPCPLCDGGFHLEAMDSHGGLIGTAADLLRFAAKFDYHGKPYTANPALLAHYGSLPGTTSLLRWRKNGVLFAAIFNLRHPGDGFEPDKFFKMDGAEIDLSLQKTADSISEWP